MCIRVQSVQHYDTPKTISDTTIEDSTAGNMMLYLQRRWLSTVLISSTAGSSASISPQRHSGISVLAPSTHLAMSACAG